MPLYLTPAAFSSLRLLPFILFFQQFRSLRFRHVYIVKRAMPAAIAAAKALFQVVFFCKHHIAIRCIVKINAVFQWCFHQFLVLPAVVCQYPPKGRRVT